MKLTDSRLILFEICLRGYSLDDATFILLSDAAFVLEVNLKKRE